MMRTLRTVAEAVSEARERSAKRRRSAMWYALLWALMLVSATLVQWDVLSRGRIVLQLLVAGLLVPIVYVISRIAEQFALRWRRLPKG
jgi:hypothetical protein